MRSAASQPYSPGRPRRAPTPRQLHLALQPRRAGVPLGGGRLVVRRRAADRGDHAGAEQPLAVAGVHRGGLAARPTRCSAANSQSPERSPVKIRPGGCRRSRPARARRPSTPGSGPPAGDRPAPVGLPANDARLSRATSSRQATSRGQARQTLTPAVELREVGRPGGPSYVVGGAATGVAAVAGSSGHPVPGGTGEGNGRRVTGCGRSLVTPPIVTSRPTTVRRWTRRCRRGCRSRRPAAVRRRSGAAPGPGSARPPRSRRTGRPARGAARARRPSRTAAGR